VLVGVAVVAPLCHAMEEAVRADVVANIRLRTGELRIANQGPSNFQLTGYQITSPFNDLNVTKWRPISGRLDVNGDQSFDPDDAWTIISPSQPFPTTSNQLVEGVFPGDGGSLSPGESVYLGAVWFLNRPKTVGVLVADEVGPVPINIPVHYLPAGDYDENGTVNLADYTLWKNSFGATGLGLLADGNGDQVVNLIDYTLWRDNRGATATAATTALLAFGSSTVIPEPPALTILAIALLLFTASGRHRPTEAAV
jgi:hypothetical protein